MAKILNKTLEFKSVEEFIRVQIIVHLVVTGIKLSDREIKCLIMIATNKLSLSEACNKGASDGIFKSPQVVRNFIGKAIEKLNIVENNNDLLTLSGISSLLIPSERSALVLKMFIRMD